MQLLIVKFVCFKWFWFLSIKGCFLSYIYIYGFGSACSGSYHIYWPLILFYLGHKNWVLCIAWSPDGKHLVSGSMAGELQCWNPETGKPSGNQLVVKSLCLMQLDWICFKSLHFVVHIGRIHFILAIMLVTNSFGLSNIGLPTNICKLSCLRDIKNGLRVYLGNRSTWMLRVGAL